MLATILVTDMGNTIVYDKASWIVIAALAGFTDTLWRSAQGAETLPPPPGEAEARLPDFGIRNSLGC